jgi:DNA polymerase I
VEVEFQLLDCDYISPNDKVILRLFGKTIDGKTVCVFYDKFKPYFYVLPKQKNKVIQELKEKFSKDIINIEEVEKFLPIGYQKEKTKVLKITLNNPARTPIVRDFLNKSENVEEIFEADILFRYRFMADFGLSGMKWVKAIGKVISTTNVRTDICLEAEKLENLEKIENVTFKFLSIDIEVPTQAGLPSPKEHGIGIISLTFYPAFQGKNTLVLISKPVGGISEDTIIFENEREMLRKFLEIVIKFDPDIITGYNLENFDLPYINERLKELKLPRAIGRCSQKPMLIKKISENRFRCNIVGRIIADPYLVIKEMARRGFFLGLKRFGLGDVSKYLLNEDKVDITHSEIPKYWNGSKEEIKKIIDYARKDSQLAIRVLIEKNFLDKYIGLSQVCGLLLQDTLDLGEAGKIENLLLREFNKMDFILPCKPSGKEIKKREEEREKKGLKGAFVFDPVIGLHTNCTLYLDFVSMYPSFIVSFNICPTTLLFNVEEVEYVQSPYGTKFVSPKVRKGIFPEIVKKLIENRKKIKELLKNEKDITIRRALDAQQEALKRMANAFYGYTGFVRARIYALDIANAITSYGRKYIKLTKEIVEKETPYKAIYGDTDSVMIETDTQDVERAFEIGNELTRLITEKVGVLQMKIESVFKTLLIHAKKRYAGWSFEKIDDKWSDTIVMKGIETVRRDWCELVSETLNKILEIILKEQNPKKALDYFKDIVQKIQNEEIPLEKLLIVKGISKRIEDYKGVQPHVELVKKMKKRPGVRAPGVGDRIGYIIVKGVEPISERAEDLEWIKKHNLKVDSRYYIESQLLPPIERIFESMGIARSELVGIGKQLQLNQLTSSKKEVVLEQIDGFICDKCNKTYQVLPLSGKCLKCGGELSFFNNKIISKYAAA